MRGHNIWLDVSDKKPEQTDEAFVNNQISTECLQAAEVVALFSENEPLRFFKHRAGPSGY